MSGVVSSSRLIESAPSLGIQRGLPTKIDDNNPEAIRQVAKQFESMFMHQVFKTMRATVPEGELTKSGFGGKVFTDMLDQQYADKASASGQLGIADAIVRQMTGVDKDPRLMPRRPTKVNQAAAATAYAGTPAASGWARPVQGGRISSHFGMRKLGHEDHARHHKGLDIAASTGTPIQAARAGTVTFAGQRGGYGNTVVVDHGGSEQTLYAHAHTLDVKEGDRVSKGQKIATVGSTGNSTGPHLHFEIRRGGKAVDPATALGIKH